MNNTQESLNRINKAKNNNAKFLDLSLLKLKTIPGEVFRLNQLEFLFLSGKSLDLSSNLLHTLPKEIVELNQLTSLNLINNNFQSVPEKVFQYEPAKLIEFILSLP